MDSEASDGPEGDPSIEGVPRHLLSDGRLHAIYLERAKNELDLARVIFRVSTSPALKLDLGLKLDLERTK